ncbi:FtsX-like permease family protein [Flexivirga meconopsidis]|uniref:FtsX-like permease family protein n=1 Tax=Flexivirga meconopsidis TaxID=2977121 RepID=UPI00223FB772|nr:FtsX-like permease family protein [Flexivirga meconopsidis]
MRFGSLARRSRRTQNIVVGFVVMLLVTSCAVTPLLVRSLERAMVTARVSALPPAGRQIQLSSGLLPAAGRPTPQQLQDALPAALQRLGPAPVQEERVETSARNGTNVILSAMVGSCQHLRLTQGRCPSKAGEVILSPEAARYLNTRVGARVAAPGPNGADVTLVGLFQQPDTGGYWAGQNVHSVQRISGRDGVPVPTVYAFTAGATFPRDVNSPATSESRLAVMLDPSKMTPTSLRQAVTGIAQLNALAGSGKLNATVFEPITQVNSQVHHDLDQVGVIVPLMMVQLLILLAIMLWLVLRSYVDRRRPELALARIRGQQVDGARRGVIAELALPVIVGAVAGVVLAYAADWLVRALWLPSGTPGGWSGWAFAAAGAGLLLVAVEVLLSLRPALRSPVTELMRAVPARVSGLRLRPFELVAALLALVLAVLVATKSLSGVVALLSPLFVAIVFAVVIAAVLPVLASRWINRSLRRGGTRSALTAAQLGRRPATRLVLVALVVACAMTVFTADVVARSSANHGDRAAVETGAVSRIDANSTSILPPTASVLKAVSEVDPSHRTFTPVVEVRSPSPDGPLTMGVIPDDMARIAATGGQDPVPWDKLKSQAGAAAPAIVAGWSTPSNSNEFTAPSLGFTDGTYRTVATVPFLPEAQQHGFVTDLTRLMQGGDRTDNVTTSVLATTDDPAQLGRMTQALKAVGYDQIDVRTAAQQRRIYDQSASGWGLQLGLFVALISTLIGVLALVAVLAASSRERRADLRALREAGVPQKTLRGATILEQVVLTVSGVALGAIAGIIGTHIAGPLIPWFAEPPDFPVTQTSVDWAVSVGVVVALLVALGLAGLIAGLLVSRREGAAGA